jgi:hypothetical protein
VKRIASQRVSTIPTGAEHFAGQIVDDVDRQSLVEALLSDSPATPRDPPAVGLNAGSRPVMSSDPSAPGGGVERFGQLPVAVSYR